MKRNNNIASLELDQLNSGILGLLTQNYNNNRISTVLKIPLSTIQRRLKKIFRK